MTNTSDPENIDITSIIGPCILSLQRHEYAQVTDAIFGFATLKQLSQSLPDEIRQAKKQRQEKLKVINASWVISCT